MCSISTAGSGYTWVQSIGEGTQETGTRVFRREWLIPITYCLCDVALWFRIRSKACILSLSHNACHNPQGSQFPAFIYPTTMAAICTKLREDLHGAGRGHKLGLSKAFHKSSGDSWITYFASLRDKKGDKWIRNEVCACVCVCCVVLCVAGLLLLLVCNRHAQLTGTHSIHFMDPHLFLQLHPRGKPWLRWFERHC